MCINPYIKNYIVSKIVVYLNVISGFRGYWSIPYLHVWFLFHVETVVRDPWWCNISKSIITYTSCNFNISAIYSILPFKKSIHYCFIWFIQYICCLITVMRHWDIKVFRWYEVTEQTSLNKGSTCIFMRCLMYIVYMFYTTKQIALLPLYKYRDITH